MSENGKPNEIKACIHCIHLEMNGTKYVCRATEARAFKLDLVTGEYPQLSAYEMRAHKGRCGPDGKLYDALPQPTQAIAAEAQAIVAASGAPMPGVGARAANVAVAVMMLPVDGVRLVGAYGHAKWCGFKLGCATFGAKVRAARQAWNSIADNVRPIPLTAEPDPIREAQDVADGKGPIVNQEAMAALMPEGGAAQPEAKDPKPEDTQTTDDKADKPAEPKPGDLPQTEGADKQGVPLAKVPDARAEAALAQAVALAVAALLLGWVVAGMSQYSANHPGTLSSVLKMGAVAGGCTECRKGEYCHPCIPPRDRREASWQGVNPCKADRAPRLRAPRYQTATLH